MSDISGPAPPNGGTQEPQLTLEEEKSVTHGGFWIPEGEREVYRDALRALVRDGPPFVVGGLYALYHYTGIYRKTKDLDLLLQPPHVVEAAQVLKERGFRTVLQDRHWLAKAYFGPIFVDLCYGMANGLHLIDEDWIRHSRSGELIGVPVRVAAPEDLVFHRLFVWERHRSDMADVAHLILLVGPRLNWRRLLQRMGSHWRLLLAQLHFYDFAYPGRPERVPVWVRQELEDRAGRDLRRLVGQNGRRAPSATGEDSVCQGTLISRFSFSIDVNEWGFRDYRSEAVEASRTLPVIEEIAASGVWQARPEDEGPDEGSPREGGGGGVERGNGSASEAAMDGGAGSEPSVERVESA